MTQNGQYAASHLLWLLYQRHAERAALQAQAQEIWQSLCDTLAAHGEDLHSYAHIEDFIKDFK